MPILEVEIEFSAYCSCGHGLCGQTITGKDKYGNLSITVESCEKCLDDAFDKGKEEGFKEASEKVE